MTAGLLFANDVRGRYPDSYYAATANGSSPRPSLEGSATCDVCVIGAGYTGLSAALHLAENGFDTMVVEAHRVGWGASGRNGGQVGSGQRVGQSELESLLGQERARALWHLGQEANGLVRELVATHDIRCDLKSGVIYADHRKRYVAHSHREADLLRRDYGYDRITALNREDIRHELGTDAYYGGVLDMGAAQLHPLNYALGLADAAVEAGARVFENSHVTGFRENDPISVTTDSGEIRAKYLVVACNGYLDGLDGRISARVMPINNFIIATEPLGEALSRQLIRNDYAVADSKFVVNYYRLSPDRRLLFGGGESYGYRFPGDITRLVRKHLNQIYPQTRDVGIDYAWGGTLAITMNRLPFIRRLSTNTYTAGGYSGHGVALATLSGKLVAEAIAGKGERFGQMADLPAPRFPGGTAFRQPLLALAMSYYALRDRL